MAKTITFQEMLREILDMNGPVSIVADGTRYESFIKYVVVNDAVETVGIVIKEGDRTQYLAVESITGLGWGEVASD